MVNYLLLLIGFLPFLNGGTGLLAESLILTLPLLLLIIGWRYKTFSLTFFNRFTLIFITVFSLAILFSTFFSASKMMAIPAAAMVLAEISWFGLFVFLSPRIKIDKLAKIIIVTGLALSIASFWFALPITGKPTSAMNIVYANYGHNHLSGYLIIVLPIAFISWYCRKGKNTSFRYLLALIIMLFAFFLSFSRGGLVVFIIEGILISLFLLKGRARLSALIAVGLSITVLAGVYTLSGFNRKSYDSTIARQDWFYRQTAKPELAASRISYWQQAIDGFRARPLFGFGPGNFEIVALRYQRGTAEWSNLTHNYFLQLLSEVGIFGLIFVIYLVWLMYHSGKQLFKNKEKLALEKAIWLGGLGSILHSFLDYDWSFPAVFLTFLLVMAVLLRLSRRMIKVQSISPPKIITLLLVISVSPFIFGTVSVVGGQVASLLGNNRLWLHLSPWPSTLARKLADQIITEDPPNKEKVLSVIAKLSAGDPSTHYWLGDYYYSSGRFKQAADEYYTYLQGNPLGGWNTYQRLIGLYQKLGEPQRINQLLELLKANLSRYDLSPTSSTPGFSKTLYQLGLAAYYNDQLADTVYFWDKASRLLPEWSYFYLENASVYRLMGREDLVLSEFRRCLSFYYPVQHCQDYLDSGGLEEPGYFADEIAKIPDK